MKQVPKVVLIVCIVVAALTTLLCFLYFDNNKIFTKSTFSPSENLAVADSLYEAGKYEEALTRYHLIAETPDNLELKDSTDINALLTASLMEAQIHTDIYNNYGNTLKALNKGEKIAGKYGLSKDGLNFLFGSLYFTIASQNNADEYYDKGASYFIENINDSVGNGELRDYSVTNLILFADYGNIRKLSDNELRRYFANRGKEENKNFEFNLSLDSMMRFVRDKNYPQASRIATKLRTDTALPIKRVLPGVYFISGKIAEESDNLEEARDYMEVSESLIQPENGMDMMLNVYEGLEDVYRKLNNIPKAEEYADRSRDIRKELTSFAQISSLKNAEVEEEMSLIKEDLDSQTKKNENFKKGLILIIVFLTISFIFILVMLYFYRKLQENNKMLYQRYQDLLKLRGVMHNKPQQVQNGLSKEDLIEREEESNESPCGEKQKFSEEITKIDEILDNSDEIFSPDFSAARLSAMTGINTHTLSSIISQYYQSTFRNLINTRRIRTVCERLETTSMYDHLTIDAIADDVGIKSRTTFTTAFKAETGMTPGKYLQFAMQRKEQKALV